MCLSVDKCACIHSSHSCKAIYKFGAVNIQNVSSFKDLGLLGIIRSDNVVVMQIIRVFAASKVHEMIVAIIHNLLILTARLGCSGGSRL